MKDNRIKNIILWTIVIAYTLWIFHNSAQTGKVSANLSQTLSYRIYDQLQFLHFMPFQLFHTLIRKFAHFSEYALLGILVSTISSHTIQERKQKMIIILWMVLIPFIFTFLFLQNSYRSVLDSDITISLYQPLLVGEQTTIGRCVDQ